MGRGDSEASEALTEAPDDRSKGYGSVEEGKVKDADERMEWEENGDILWLGLEVAVSAGWQISVLLVLFFNVVPSSQNDGNTLLRCRYGPPGSPDVGWKYALACKYTKAYVSDFPALALTMAMLFAGRVLLQKRLYYDLLKVGGVLEFSAHSMFSDPLCLVLLWCFLHVLIHPFLAFFVGDEGLGDEFGKDSHGNFVPQTDKAMFLVRFLVVVAVPALLFLLFVYNSYDLEKSLVPLSQYIRNIGEKNRNCGVSARTTNTKEMSSLVSVWDLTLQAEMKHFLKQDEHQQFGKLKPSIKAILERCSKIEQPQVPPYELKLRQGLWPGKLLLRPTMADKNSKAFRNCWVIFAGTVILIIISMLGFLGWCAYYGLMAATGLDERAQAAAGVFAKHVDPLNVLGSVAQSHLARAATTDVTITREHFEGRWWFVLAGALVDLFHVIMVLIVGMNIAHCCCYLVADTSISRAAESVRQNVDGHVDAVRQRVTSKAAESREVTA